MSRVTSHLQDEQEGYHVGILDELYRIRSKVPDDSLFRVG